MSSIEKKIFTRSTCLYTKCNENRDIYLSKYTHSIQEIWIRKTEKAEILQNISKQTEKKHFFFEHHLNKFIFWEQSNTHTSSDFRTRLSFKIEQKNESIQINVRSLISSFRRSSKPKLEIVL